MMSCKRLLMGVAFLLALSGCATPWEQAKTQNTADGYRAFIQNNPKSAYLNKARSALDSRSWVQARTDDSIASYQAYLNTFPDGRHRRVANTKLTELAWNGAKTSNTIDAYRSFLVDHPTSKFQRPARAALEQLSWTQAKRIDSIETYDTYVQDFGDVKGQGHTTGTKKARAKKVKQARKRIAALAWSNATQANTPAAYTAFIRDYPVASQRFLAREKLAEFRREDARREADKFARDPASRFVELVNNGCNNLRAATANKAHRYWCRKIRSSGNGKFAYRVKLGNTKDREIELSRLLLEPKLHPGALRQGKPGYLTVRMRCAPLSPGCEKFAIIRGARFDFRDEFNALVAHALLTRLTQRIPATCSTRSKNKAAIAERQRTMAAEDKRLAFVKQVEAGNLPRIGDPSRYKRFKVLGSRNSRLYVTRQGKRVLSQHRTRQAQRLQDIAFLERCLSK